MSDDIWHDADLSEAKRTVEQQRDGNHSSLYSNPEQAARHLLKKYGVEEALAAWREMGRDPEVIRAVIAEGSEGNVDEEKMAEGSDAKLAVMVRAYQYARGGL